MPYSGLNPAGSGLNLEDNDFIQASAKPNSSGDRTVSSAYGEIVVPLVTPKNQLRGVTSLELSGSARFEHYSDFGNTLRPKFGINYKPVQSVMIRASFNEGFTAPALPTLYAPTQFTVDSPPGTVDLYRNPYTNEGPYVMKSFTLGNPGLQPQTSIGKSAGIVLDVPKVRGLSFTADYWQIDQSNLIGSYTSAQILTTDAALLNAYTQSQLAAGVPLSNINLGSGTPNYRGDPRVTRNPVTATDQALFAAYNARNPNAPAATAGTIASRTSQTQNLSKGFASG